MKAKLSVAICTHNGGPFVEDQLNSIAAQTRLPDEIIVCDDQSRDETVRIVKRFAADSRLPLRLIVNSVNLGVVKNFEQAIGLCTGDIIALCDQDDVWQPTKLAQIETAFHESPAAGLVFTDAELVDEQLRPTGCSLWEKLEVGAESIQQLKSRDAFDELITGSIVTGATAAFRSQFNSLVLPIPDDLPIIHDAWIAILISAVARILPVSERLIKYRQHARQQIGARERLSPRHGLLKQSPREALRRENPYEETIAVMSAVRGRLLAHLDHFEAQHAIGLLDAKARHLRARAGLPKSRWLRTPRILRELFSGRYHRYSSGMYSAIKDLASPSRLTSTDI